MVVGALSLFLCWLPALGIGVSSLGMLLGLAGAAVGFWRHGSGLGYCVAGFCLSALGLIPAIIWISFLSNLGSNLGVGQLGVTAGTWLSMDQAASVGDAEVRLTKAWIGPVKLKSFGSGEPFDTKESYLQMRLTISNRSKTRILNHRSWGERVGFLAPVALLDNFENVYFRALLHDRFEVKESMRVQPGDTAIDLIAFQLPIVAGADHLRLTLEAKSLGGGYVQFKVPVSAIER